MGSELVQAQWSLNQTSDSVYNIARGVLQAATSDNVQPLAILACEQFGNTLAISRETRLRIERTVLPTPEPVTIRFLKAKVGYSRHDCALQLGSNQAGLRFLALAAALISSISPRRCADALMLMLEETTSDKRLLPTTRHLTDLMSSLEGRCRLSGFADTVFGYESIITGASRKKRRGQHAPWHYVPDEKGLADLVDACRRLQRVGDDKISSIAVEVSRGVAAWVAAFCRWSLELPPSICFRDGTPILSQPGSQVTITLVASEGISRTTLKIIRRYKVDSIQDLVVEHGVHGRDNCHVQFATYCNILHRYCGSHDWVRDAIFAALPFTISWIRKMIEPKGCLDTVSYLGHKSIRNYVMKTPDYLPSTKTLERTMRRVFDLSPEFPFDSLASVNSYEDLPEVRHYSHMISSCSKPEDVPFDSSYNFINVEKATRFQGEILNPAHFGLNPYSWSAFIGNLAILCRSILLLSMFDNAEDLYFTIPGEDLDFTKGLEKILITGENDEHWGMQDILVASVRLLTQQPAVAGFHDEVIVISTGTHVVWHSILDNFTPRLTGSLGITSCRGQLWHDRETYQNIRAIGNPPRLTISENIFAHARLQWELFASQGNLYADTFLIDDREPKTVYDKMAPMSAVKMLKASVLVNCEHAVETPDEIKGLLSKGKYAKLRIIQTGGVTGVQMYGLLSIADRNSPKRTELIVAISRRACFACCIDACETVKAQYLLF